MTSAIGKTFMDWEVKDEDCMERYDKKDLIDLFPLPARDANKYSRGKVILFAGSALYPGAAILAACASQRAGVGYTQVITAPLAVPVVQAHQPSLVVSSWKSVYESDLDVSSSKKPCAYVVGPGFDTEKASAYALASFVLEKAKAPLLVDGGGLSVLLSSTGQNLCKNRFVEGLPTVITPHGGEALRLAEVFDLPTHDPAHLAYALSLAYGVITVLKGPETFVSDGEEIFAVSSGTPALAKAGTGDVLAGMIGAFLAQGLDPLDASVLGVTLHAKAGCLAAEALTEVSVTAEDVIEYIPAGIKEIIT